jgi:uncharacterized ubiquitin-like protein YukD
MKYLVCLLPILVGCHTKSLDHYRLDAWKGRWESSDSTGNFIETWKKINDTLYQGRGIMIANKDTLFSEDIKLIYKKNTVHYVVKAEGQNGEEEVRFELTKFANDTWIFENPQHDFPKRITYYLKSTGSLIATIEGLQGTVPKIIILQFKSK